MQKCCILDSTGLFSGVTYKTLMKMMEINLSAKFT